MLSSPRWIPPNRHRLYGGSPLSIAVIQTPAGFGGIEWGTIIAIVGFVSMIAVVLLRDRFRTPTTFVTNIEQDSLRKSLELSITRLEQEFRELRQEVRLWEDEFRGTCASVKDLDGMGTRVNSVEKFLLSVQDSVAVVKGESSRALTEVAYLRENITRVEKGVADITAEIRPLRDAMNRIEGHLGVLLQRSNGTERNPQGGR